MSALLPTAALAALGAGAAAAVLARAAPALGWLDRPGARKPQPAPVAPVGGAALLLAGAALALAPGVEAPWLAAPGPLATGLLPGGLAAFAVGLTDDLLPGGLRVRAKLAGQVVAGLAFALPAALAAAESTGAPAGILVLAALALAAVVAQNAVNTFDNADGAATALGACALALPAPALAAALAGLLPLHLAPRRAGAGARRRPPQVYLGDAGSHLLGIALLAFPAAWPALALPALDLARVARERLRAGRAPWVGDRRHLAHRLEARGLGRGAVVAALLVIGAPAALAGAAGVLAERPLLVAVGLAATAALHALVWALPPRPRAAQRLRMSAAP